MKSIGQVTDHVLSSYVTRKGYGYNQNYQHQVQLKTDGVNANLVAWMIENCEGKWGWHFTDNGAVMTFNKETDSVFFTLVHGAL